MTIVSIVTVSVGLQYGESMDLIKNKIDINRFYLPAIILLGLLLRFYQIGEGLLTFNEVAEVSIASFEASKIIYAIKAMVHSPPLYHFLLHFWMYLGNGEFTLRMFSLITGTLTIPFIYLLAKEFFDERIGLISAFLMAVMPIQVHFSQIARAYSLLTLLTLISIYYFVKILKDQTNIWLWIGYIISTILCTYTHYYAFIIVITSNIAVLLMKKNFIFYKKWFTSQLVLAIMYIPWLPILFYVESMRNRPYTGSIPPNPSLMEIPKTFEYFSTSISHTFNSWIFDPIILVVAILLYTYLFIKGVAVLKDYQNNQKIILLVFLAFPLIIAFIYGFKIKAYSARYLIHTAFAYYIILALAVSNIKNRHVFITIIACILLISVGTIYPNTQYLNNLPKNDIPDIFEFIIENSEPTDIIVYPEMPLKLQFLYYYNNSLEFYSLPEDWDWDYGNSRQWYIHEGNMPLAIQNLEKYSIGKKRIWYINVNYQNLDTPQLINNLKKSLFGKNVKIETNTNLGGDLMKDYMDENYNLIMKNETISKLYVIYLYEVPYSQNTLYP